MFYFEAIAVRAQSMVKCHELEQQHVGDDVQVSCGNKLVVLRGLFDMFEFVDDDVGYTVP